MKNVLIAYGTRYGSTGIVAGEIGNFLKARGHSVNLVNLRKERVREDPGSYDFVIAGSGIAMFSWVGSVKRFLKRCRRAGSPTIVFICAGMAIETPEKAVERFLDRIVRRIGITPVITEAIAPVLDFRPEEGVPLKKKNRIRNVIQALAKDSYNENGLMDLRDKARFDDFLKRVAAQLEG